MCVELIEFQIALSTGEQEETLFGDRDPVREAQGVEEACLSPGTYRVVDGELYRLVPGVPPREDLDQVTDRHDSSMV